MDSANHSPPRILVVDDDDGVLHTLERVLSRPGWEVRLASRGEEGLRALDAQPADVVLADYLMPGMNGIEFLTAVKQRWPRTQRLLLTGFADQEVLWRANHECEVFHFIAKPWDEVQLLTEVEEALEGVRLGEENDRLVKLTQVGLAAAEERAELEQKVVDRTRLLMRAKRDWEVTFDAINSPVSIVDADCQLRRVNLAFARTAELDVRDTVGKKCHQALFGRQAPCENCALSKVLSTKKPSAELEIAGRRERTFKVAIYPVVEKGGGGWISDHAVCVYRDVTEEKELSRRMLQTEKMAAIGQLAGGVAHEINNPLGGILAFAQLMKREAGRGAEDLESLRLIEESALRCKHIVESLLKFSRRTKSEKVPMELNRAAEDAVFLFRAQLKSKPRADLKLMLGEKMPRVLGDSNQLQQVMLNFMQNSMQALPDGEGTISIETGTTAEGPYFAVADTGSGIAPEHLPHVFEPSFTTKPPGEGTGFGLAIVYGLVEEHHGRIEVQTQLGKGTQFTVHLPALPEPD